MGMILAGDVRWCYVAPGNQPDRINCERSDILREHGKTAWMAVVPGVCGGVDFGSGCVACGVAGGARGCVADGVRDRCGDTGSAVDDVSADAVDPDADRGEESGAGDIRETCHPASGSGGV